MTLNYLGLELKGCFGLGDFFIMNSGCFLAFLKDCISLLTISLRTRVMSWLVFPPFIIMAVFTSSTSLGARLSRKRFERLVFGFLVKHNQSNYCLLFLSFSC